MTTTASWLSVSGSGKRTFYLGADSLGTAVSGRIEDNRSIKKVCASSATPEVFVFAGDASWGAEFLRGASALAHGKQSPPLGTSDRAREVCALRCAKPPRVFVCELDVLYGVREGTGRQSHFRLFQLKHSGVTDEEWSVTAVGEKQLAHKRSTRVYSSGFGGKTYGHHQKWVSSGPQGDVSRTCFWALSDLVEGRPRNNLMTGGVPQLVKLDQSGSGADVGVKFYGRSTLHGGGLVTSPKSMTKFWVDQNFTSLDHDTMQPWSRGQNYERRDGR